MSTIRRATAADSELLAEQRVLMFVDAGVAEERAMGPMRENFIPWVRERLLDGRYIGWIAEEAGHAVGGAGLWVMDWPPMFLDAKPQRGYLLNFYVAPDARRRGIARELLALAVAEVKARRLGVVTLHASKYGRPLYEQFGFQAANEMRLVLEL
ncbi:MAG TPA: GNAT family N-acetyltransferase [Acidobacteriaceae bacterium]|nr:GNAT family N-acetyltransferase [Acidobacteriaceae bacterium]